MTPMKRTGPVTPAEALSNAAESLKQATAAVLHEATCNGHVKIADRWIAIAGTLTGIDFTNSGITKPMDRVEDGR